MERLATIRTRRHPGPVKLVDQGRLFVVHGRLESVTCDVAVVVTDDSGLLGQHWSDVAGPRNEPLDMTRGWATVPLTTDPGAPIVLAVSIETTYDEVLRRLDAVLRETVRAVTLPTRGAMSPPLVAMPVVGIGAGGFSERRGDVVRALVDHLSSACPEIGVDVALVTPDPAVHAAAQHARRYLPSPVTEELEDHARRLGALARRGRLAVFMGAGVSIPSGLPSWHELLGTLAKRYSMVDVLAAAGDFSATDKAGLIEKSSEGGFRRVVAESFSGEHRPSLLHAMVAALDPHEVITTNYDLLYEEAVEATGRGIASVMPWESALESDRWILKLHGDVAHPDQIVLTRHHMVRYDAVSRPSASMLQSLLLTRHTLFVGVSMTDDNVLRLMHEVEAYLTANEVESAGTFGTVLDVAGDSARARLWADQLTWLDLDSGVLSGTRAVEIFLDRVALHASRNSSWLLDERFAGLLEPTDQDLAERARSLFQLLSSRESSPWAPLERQLRKFGARTVPDDG